MRKFISLLKVLFCYVQVDGITPPNCRGTYLDPWFGDLLLSIYEEQLRYQFWLSYLSLGSYCFCLKF
jgi:hypothetical protein